MVKTRFGTLITMLAIVGSTAACGGVSDPPAEDGTDDSATTTEASGEPIRIAVLNPTTGPYASLGEEINEGIQLYWDERGASAGGREIELVFEDTTGEGEVALERARKVIEQDDVDLIMGLVSSASALAIEDYVGQHEVPLILTNASADALTAEADRPMLFRASYSSYQKEAVGGWYVAEELGYDRIALVAYDYVAGREHADGFKETFEASGGEIVKEVYLPLGVNDVGPYINDVESVIDDVDAVVTLLWLPTSVPWMQAWSDFGLSGNAPLVGVGDMVDETVLQDMGPAAEGYIGWRFYVPTADNAENVEFVESMNEAIGRNPTIYHYQGYVGAQAVAQAIEGAGGDMSGFVDRLQDVEFTTPAGYDFRFDELRNVVFTTFFHRTESTDDGFENVIIDEIPDTDQFWSPGS